ncbi:alkaline phosphatase [bacterium]|nr:alkaline phosphatase [bacterium]
MTHRFSSAAAGILTLLLLSCSPSQDRAPLNVILLIGDGMGVAQLTAGKTVKGTISMERFPVAGLVTTHAAGSYITDSAASGTALATGHKTDNGVIGMAPDHMVLKNVTEYAEESGCATGLVATSAITHVTPACFAAHVPERHMYAEVAEDLCESGVDVLFGGGYGYFLPSSHPQSLRTDDRNLMKSLAGTHRLIYTPAGLDSLADCERVAGLFYQGHPPAVHERNTTLSALTEAALSVLSRSRRGFFLMVEGSQIDWSGHDNDSQGIIDEFIDFDDAVGTAADWALARGNTLVIVVADHETGGYTLLNGSIEERTVTEVSFSTSYHTGSMVPLFALGPGASRFSGILDNTDIGSRLIELFRGR